MRENIIWYSTDKKMESKKEDRVLSFGQVEKIIDCYMDNRKNLD